MILEKRLVSCCQLSNIESMYYWHGKRENTKEVLLKMKTKTELYPEIESTIKATHSYEVPEIVAYDIKNASQEYLNWIELETKNKNIMI